MATRLSQQQKVVQQIKNDINNNYYSSTSSPAKTQTANSVNSSSSVIKNMTNDNKRALIAMAFQAKFGFKDFSSLDTNLCINKLIYGMSIKKATRKGNGSWHNVYFYILDVDLSILQWISAKKPFNQTRVNLKTILNISELPTKSLGSKINRKSKLLLAIQHSGGELVLQFNTELEKHEWWNGLQYFILLSLNQFEKTQEKTSIIAKDVFIASDKQGNKTLDKNEMFDALRRMNIHTTKKHANEIFNEVDLDKNNEIDYQEFNFMVKQLLIREELIDLFKNYCSSYIPNDYDTPLMKITEFMEFFRVEQNQIISYSDAMDIINGSKEEDDNKHNDKLSFMNFMSIIYSDLYNSIFNSDYVELYQDMNRPLVDYYISSSHNTYLVSNQLTGESSVNAYVSALMRGFRLVELDLWNGEHDEPIVYHGHTLTSKIYLRDICQAIRIHGFENNPFPIILSFEMHCDHKGQENIANILKQEFGSLIYYLPNDYMEYDQLPSPHALKNKILIKGKRNIMTETGEVLMSESNIQASSLNNIREFDNDEDLELKMSKKMHYSSTNNNDKNTSYMGSSVVKKSNYLLNSKAKYLGIQVIEEEEKVNSIGYHKDYDKNSEAYFLYNKRMQDNIKLQSPDKYPDLQESGQDPQLKTDVSQKHIDKSGNVNRDGEEYLQNQDNFVKDNEEDLPLPHFNTCEEIELPKFIQNSEINLNENQHNDRTNDSSRKFNFEKGVLGFNNDGYEDKNNNNDDDEEMIFYLDEEDQEQEDKFGQVNKNENEKPLEAEEDLGLSNKLFFNRKNDQSALDVSIVEKTEENKTKTNENQYSSPTKGDEHKHKTHDCPDLTELYSLIGIKWSLDTHKKRTIWHVASITESKINNLCKSHFKEVVDFHRQYITKIYPSGMRINSSNYNPVPSWNAGVQIVALNCQTADEAMFLNYAKFIANGNSGYVLKPRFLQHTAALESDESNIYPNELTKPMKSLTITIISGKQLRSTQNDISTTQNDTIDPFVEIILRGTEIDENHNHTFRTITVKNNGFNPRWSTPQKESKVTFHICSPDLCTIIFYVKNEHLLTSNLIGWYAIELKNMMTGYRAIPLMDKNFQKILHSYLLCHISINEYPSETNKKNP